MACENLKGCPFYNERMPLASGLGSIYRKKYCEGDKTLCARYRVGEKLGKERVPANLYPNMQEQADKLIQENERT